MKSHKQNERDERSERDARFEVEALECRLNPSVSIDVLGLATIAVDLSLAAKVTTPVGLNADINLHL